MTNTNEKPRFEDTPLITPEGVVQHPYEVFAISPDWLHLLHMEAHDEGDIPSPFLVVGHKYKAAISVSLCTLALLYELSRVGCSLTVNGNGLGQYYVRLIIPGASDALTMLPRLISGAGPYVQVKPDGIRSDLRPANLRIGTARKTGKETRDTVLHHASRLLEERQAAGAWPSHIPATDYTANLHRLLEAIDREAAGEEVGG